MPIIGKTADNQLLLIIGASLVLRVSFSALALLAGMREGRWNVKTFTIINEVLFWNK